jgi:hypothetical protein
MQCNHEQYVYDHLNSSMPLQTGEAEYSVSEVSGDPLSNAFDPA